MIEKTEAKQVSRAASSLLFPELDFGVADNGTYPSEYFQRVLARIAFDNEFANTGAKAYQLARGDDIAVDTDARNAQPSTNTHPGTSRMEPEDAAAYPGNEHDHQSLVLFVEQTDDKT